MNSSTIRVQRANVLLDISPEQKEYYMQKGYSVVDEKTGKVLEQAISNDLKTLQSQVISLTQTLKEKDKEIEALKKKLKPTSSK